MTDDDRPALVVAHEPDGLGGQISARLLQRGFVVDTHVVTKDSALPNESVPFPDFGSYDVVVIMGSVRSLTNKKQIDSWVYDELDRIRAAYAADQPVLGICFGGQLMAEALGGAVEVAPVTEIGWHDVAPADDLVNPVGPGPWMEWHHDRFSPPPGATVLATTPNAAQLYTIGRMVGTQFHPEIDFDHVANWLKSVESAYLEKYGQDRDEVLSSVRENEARNIEQCHALVDWFLDEVAYPEGNER